ncbi:MAG TPA: hypothetical protein VF432_03105 [Thermoanaerobaculia bacterium]
MRAFLVALFVFAAPLALGELAPEVYKAMQQAAPEVLYLEVTEVDIDRDFHKPSGCGFFEFEVLRNVTAKAKVLRVVRSRSGVRPGAVITVPYQSLRQCSGFSGARPIPLLEEGMKTYAYLTAARRGFEPAARGASFSPERGE